MALWTEAQLRELIATADKLGYHEDVTHFENELNALQKEK